MGATKQQICAWETCSIPDQNGKLALFFSSLEIRHFVLWDTYFTKVLNY